MKFLRMPNRAQSLKQALTKPQNDNKENIDPVYIQKIDLKPTVTPQTMEV